MERTEPRGRYSRGYLPHIDAGSVPQFITWRLADSVPVALIKEWEAELYREPESKRKLEMYRRVESQMDRGGGACLLKNPIAARIVHRYLMSQHTILYELHEWVVMPNHVHVLLTPVEGCCLGKLVGQLKGRTSHDINEALGRVGRLWQPDYYDRIVRSDRQFEGTAYYIRRNPVKARLCQDATLWPYGSANPETRAQLRGLKPAGRGAP